MGLWIAGKLLKSDDLPKEEENFQRIYVKSPSFLSMHLGVRAEVLPPGTDCHHFILEVRGALISLSLLILSHRVGPAQDDWERLEEPYGSIFLSIPTVLDPSLAPEGHHILHVFTTASIDDWKVRFDPRIPASSLLFASSF